MFCFLFYKPSYVLPPKKTVTGKENIIDLMEAYPNKRGMQQWRLWVTEEEEKKVVFFLFPDFSKCDLEK